MIPSAPAFKFQSLALKIKKFFLASCSVYIRSKVVVFNPKNIFIEDR